MNESKLTICDRIEKFLEGKQGAVATLKDFYSIIKDHAEETVRAAIYRDRKDRFKKVAAGVYMLKKNDVAGLLIEGDGKKLEGVEDGSIQLIVTDHPWDNPKSLKSGNQRNFADDYEGTCFNYTQEHFDTKARVLEEGGYLAEFVPVETFTNWEYLTKIKQMAKKAGLEYYAKVTWCKAPEGTINTGRTTKGLEDVIIFTKGKPKRLSPKGKPYFTSKILNSRIEIPAPSPKDKRHQAEKPVALFEYLIDMLSEEGSIVLDQFGGSCNCMEAALNKNRFAIVYEYLGKFVDRAVERFKAIPLYNSREDYVDSENGLEEQSGALKEELKASIIKPIEKKVEQVFNTVSQKDGETEILQLQLSF